MDFGNVEQEDAQNDYPGRYDGVHRRNCPQSCPRQSFIVALGAVGFVQAKHCIDMANHDFSAPAAVADGFNRNGIVPLEHHVQQFQCGFFLLTIMFASLVRIDRTRAMFFEHPIVLQEQLRVPQPAVTPACGFTGLLGHNFLCTLA